MHNLSVVHIAPEQYKDVINAIGEAYGVGPNSLSVKLVDATGNIFWGCHSWWNVDDYAEFTDPDKRALMFAAYPPEQQELFTVALAVLYERLELNGMPKQNEAAAYAELGLSKVEELL